jgi:cytochrome c peroxidase
VAVGVLTVAAACAPSDESFDFALPPGLPPPWVPDDNPMTAAKVTLGRHLFYDKRLSVNGTMACASCHEQARAFTDGKALPTGATGALIPRNAMTLTNVAYYYPYTWQNPLIHTLEAQALVPLFAESPIELGLSASIGEVLEGFRQDPRYAELFPAAFPRDENPFTPDRTVAAIAAFERTLISGGSAYDRYTHARDQTALSPSAKLGMDIFFSERAECYHCHQGANFTSAFRSADTAMLGRDYQNNGLYDVDGLGAYPAPSPGLAGITRDPSDAGKFRVPTLRNVALTAPYMHDGSIGTLEEVIEHYAAGGRNVTEGPNQGDGRANPRKSPFVRGFVLTPEEKTALVDFLRALTDEAFVRDPRFADPWAAPL